MRFTILLLSLSAAASTVLADFQFVAPAAGSDVTVDSIKIAWEDSGVAPSVSDLESYAINLYTGSNTAPIDLGAIVPAGTKFSENSITLTINSNLGDSKPENAYFLGMTSIAAGGGHLINYSDRFSITGMTGTFDSATKEALAGVSGTAGPKSGNQLEEALYDQFARRQAVDTAQFAIPYAQQSGAVRYAPMQPLPGSKITAVNTAPLFPTSSVPIATAALPIASITMTYTQEPTYSFASHTNTAAAASQPVDDMQRFLNRWKD